MKKTIFKLVGTSLISLTIFSGLVSCKNDTETKYVPIIQNISDNSISEAADFSLRRCYALSDDNQTVLFLMDKKLWGVADNSDVYVHGSFNSWTHENDDTFKMNETSDFYYLEVSRTQLTALGNSGHPEFKFVVNDEYQNNYDKDFIPEPYVFHTSDENLIIIYDDENIDEIKACSETAATWRALSDWDITDSKEIEKFANFRKVPGTTNLYRSWHPYKYKTHKADVFKSDTNTKGYFVRATELVRNGEVEYLYRKYGIKTDICLSEDETNNLQTWDIGTDVAKNDNVQDSGTTYTESIPSYYQAILNAGNVLHMTFTNSEGKEETMQYKYIYQADYNEKYLNDGLQCIIDFIKEGTHPAPYAIHCRLGNDRTGYYCAVISGLCGASWAEIAEDYQKSNYTYLGEYRDQRLLKQVFEKQFNIADITNYTGSQLKTAMYKYYTTNSELKISESDLDALVAAFTDTE